MCRGTQRLRQVERRRRPHLGDGGAGREGASRRKDAGRHLRRHRRAGPARPRRGDAHDRQLRRRSAHRVLRGVHHTTDVPRRRRRVRDQRQLVPPDGRAGTAQRLRYRPGDARHRRAGSAVRDPRIASRGPARVHRGGRGRSQTPQAQGKGGPQARRDAGQPRAAHRPHRRVASTAQTARSPGRGRATRTDRSGRPARRAVAAGSGRPRHTPGRTRPPDSRRETRPRTAGDGAGGARGGDGRTRWSRAGAGPPDAAG